MKNRKKTSYIIWSEDMRGKIHPLRVFLSKLSWYARSDQYSFFLTLFSPDETTNIIDVGTTPSEKQIQLDSNFFEKVYPYKKRLTIASIEDCSKLCKELKLKQFKKITPKKELPFKNKEFDIVTSWAVIEHTGSFDSQKFFLKELSRIGTKVFITTPYKYALFDPHSCMFFVHWLPNSVFRKVMAFLGKDFYAKEENLNILDLKTVKKLLPDKRFKVKLYKLFNILPAHIIIYKQ